MPCYMIAPNYWVDRKSGNDYYLTVQFFEKGQPAIHDMADFGQIPFEIRLTEGNELRPDWNWRRRVGLWRTGQADYGTQQCC